ncbi:hypothetical protein [Nocardia sp. NPDC059239]|uniref:hypothetical protein n=1 Tax=Nocardia sp. NPDC059239 TaxID=3346785 RepID=UPI0036D16D9D
MRYTVFIRTTDAAGEPDGGRELQVTIDGAAAPKVGEILYFASEDAQLEVAVSRVEHWFYPEDDGEPYYTRVITADAGPDQHKLMQKLRNDDEATRWAAQYPLVDGAEPMLSPEEWASRRTV